MSHTMKFIDPINSVMLTNASGKVYSNALEIECQLLCKPNRQIMLNSIPMTYNNNIYKAKIRLDSYRNTLEAVDAQTGEKEKIVVYWLKKADKKYRLSIDDNIWCLQDIARNARIYKSIFDNPYLGFLKSINKQFGTKIHMNIFYQCPEFGGFSLTQMPDKYKSEWKDNANWLKLSFHSLQEFPDKPYIKAGYYEVKNDCERVNSEILRFAGPDSLAQVTTIHWNQATLEGCRALRDQGIRMLTGGFYINEKGNDTAFYLTKEQANIVRTYGFYMDQKENIIIGAGDVVLDRYRGKIRETLNASKTNYPKNTFAELVIHEQYFYSHYKAYLPNYKELILTGVKWCMENGYTPAFRGDVVFE